MWIGGTPFELRSLTLPERLLIAWYFPAAHIVKLLPKVKGAHACGRTTMNSALRGTASTYRLDPKQMDPKQIATMIAGTIMPPPAAILASTIGAAFVGPNKLPDPMLPGIFLVHRGRVRRALEGLKDNNPIYSDIEISDGRLEELPECAVPDEILIGARYSADTAALDLEREGCAPMDEDEEMSGIQPVNIDHSENGDQREGGENDSDSRGGDIGTPALLPESLKINVGCAEPLVIPLQAHGVVDVSGHVHG
ncbi:hypothetical protein DXG01_009395 [Tephrocybe rancida]|nr:hypothetical protein DXG01_009395 [Tephrocybe rancida]